MFCFFTVKGKYYWKKTKGIANIFLNKIERYKTMKVSRASQDQSLKKRVDDSRIHIKLSIVFNTIYALICRYFTSS